MFKLLVKRRVLDSINFYPDKEKQIFKDKLRSLEKDPFPDGNDKKEIKGTNKIVYRLRVGKFRFFYVIDLEYKTVRVTEFLTVELAHKKYGRI